MIKRFVKRMLGESDSPEQVRQAYGTVCGLIGIVANCFLCAGKLIAGFVCGSVAVIADGLNNLSDAGSSAVTLLGFRLAGKKPDRNHPFGHGRIEYLTGLAVSMMVILLGIELLKSSFEQILSSGSPERGAPAIMVLLIAIPVKLLLFVMNRRIGKQINSTTLLATSIDCLTDAAASSITLLALILGDVTAFPLDGICGMALAILILISGIRVSLDTVNPLLGQPPENEFVDRIKSIIAEYPQILGFHDLIVHDYGPGRRMISLHAEVSAESDFMCAHDSIDNLENRLMQELNCHAVIHMDPIVVNDDRISEMKQSLMSLVRRINPALSVHDVRIVEGPTHTNLVFDLVLPYSVKETEEKELQAQVVARIASCYPMHKAIIRMEHAFVLENESGKETE